MLNSLSGPRIIFDDTSNQMKKDYGSALTDYEASLRINPTVAAAWNGKGIAHMMLDVTEPGKEHGRKACEAIKKSCKLGDCRLVNEFTHCRERKK